MAFTFEGGREVTSGQFSRKTERIPSQSGANLTEVPLDLDDGGGVLALAALVRGAMLPIKMRAMM